MASAVGFGDSGVAERRKEALITNGLALSIGLPVLAVVDGGAG